MPKTSDNNTPIANIAPFGLRMQPRLKREVEEAAKLSGRSLNSEIIFRLEASFLQGTATPPGTDNAEIESLRIGLRVEEHERGLLERRLKQLEQQVQQIAGHDRSYDHEMRIARLESIR